MPTGYTAPIYDNQPITFRAFMLRMARAMMPLVTLRDEHMDAPLPDTFTPSTYNAEQATKGRERLAALLAITPEEAARSCAAEHAAAVETWRTARTRYAALRARYEAMLAKVESWPAPTPDHEGLKRYAAEQIRESIKWDCGEWDEPKAREPGAWLAESIADARRDIERAETRQREEEERAAFSTRWLSALRGGLPGE